MHLERAGSVLGVLIVLSICTTCQKSDHLNSKIEHPVGSEQQTIAVEATRRLRDLWNRGACEVLYEQAAFGFRSQPLPDWLTYCEYVRRKLGIWQSFVSQGAVSRDGRASIVFLEGRAVFGKGNYDVIIAWMTEDRQSRFLYLSLGQNGNAVETIPPPQQHLLDPPPPPNAGRKS